jgi:hypothetical protein
MFIIYDVIDLFGSTQVRSAYWQHHKFFSAAVAKSKHISSGECLRVLGVNVFLPAS